MCLGALLDAGVPLDYLHHHLGSLGLNDEFTLSATDTLKRGLRALQAQVNLLPPSSPTSHGHGPSEPSHPAPTPASRPPHLPRRNLSAITQMLTQAPLPARAKDWSLAIFRQLGAAEAAVHGIPIDQVHFHEVGATDAIVDIVGTCLGFDYLKIDTLVCSPLPMGQGRVNTDHGWLPVPAPAVLKLMELAQAPLYSNGLAGELVTPTGAAIVTTLAQHFGEPPGFLLKQVGLGAGRKDLPIANILRLWIGTEANAPSLGQDIPPGTGNPGQDRVTVLETQVDDLMPQAVGYLYDQLFAAGALDVFAQPIAMKKSRPGILITVICPPPCQPLCETVLFTETTTLGIRHRQQARTILERQFETVATPYGPVAIKLAHHPETQQLMNAQPEFEDCATLARRHQVPWQMVHQAALVAWGQHQAAPDMP
jgi:uncharacterized protein (TIGR00299 family) protein